MVNEQFGRKLNQDVSRNMKLPWKEMGKVNGGKVKNCNRIIFRIWRHRKMASGRKVAVDIRSLVNARGLQLEYASALVFCMRPVLMYLYGSETMI